MPDQFWTSWGTSVAGPFHIKAGIPNQDSWMARQYTWGNVVVVSDGLGSKMHADYGSHNACLAVFEAARAFHKSSNAKVVDMLRLIHANWLLKISPYTPSDCAATCLFALQTGGVITLGRLGDGMIAALGESEESHLIISDGKQYSFSNITNCLQRDFKPDQWEIVSIDSERYHAVVICTDGVSDDLLPKTEADFAESFTKAYASESPTKRGAAIRKMLNEWPVPGHTDDKTIACLLKSGGL